MVGSAHAPASHYGLTTIVPFNPTATKRVPFQAMPKRSFAVPLSLTLVQLEPSLLCTIVPAAPTATNRLPVHVTS